MPNNTVVDINDPRIPGVDSTPTSGSTNVVASSGVYAALQNILSQIVSFDSVSSNQDGTLIITLSNGDTITVDLNHSHPQYPKYVHLASESAMPATPDSETMYLIDGGGGEGGGGSYTLPIASSSTLGGIKVGDGLSINSSTGVLATISKIVYLSNESQMPANPDANTLYAIYGTGGGSGGGISDVTLGGTTVVSNGVAVLPAYPTSLPASDVSAWAKASTKPTYTASEVGALPSTTSIPTESTVSGWGFTKNTGTLTGVTFNGTSATVNNGVAAITATIPTESTVSGWGFTKNSGTITGITMNGSSKGTSGTVNLGTVVTAETDPVFTASAAHGISSTDISNWNAKQKAITVSSSEPTSSQGSNGDIWIVI